MGLNRRSFLAAGVAAAGAAAAPPAVADAAKRRRRRRPKPKPCRPKTAATPKRALPDLGSGGEPTPPQRLAQLASEVSGGDPVAFVDLAAFDRNFDVVTAFAREQGWAVRPSLKSFQCPGFAAYALAKLPEPRGLVFHLKTVDEILAAAPPGTDLMLGYPPAFDELEAFLQTAPPPTAAKGHRVRILVDSLELLDHLIALAPGSRRGTPLEIALQLEGGLELSGLREPAELTEALHKLRRNQHLVKLTAVLCYDGHGTVRPERAYREEVQRDCERRFLAWLTQLELEGSDLYDKRSLVRNGPASSTYRLWGGSAAPNEISPGTAFVYHSYLTADGHDNEGLGFTMHHATPVHRIVAPRVPLASTPDPRGLDKDNVSCKGAAWPDGKGTTTTTVFPAGLEEDELSGGRANNQGHYLAPKGVLKRGDYIVVRPKNAGDGADHFGALVAVRNGSVRRVWPTLQRPGTLAPLA